MSQFVTASFNFSSAKTFEIMKENYTLTDSSLNKQLKVPLKHKQSVAFIPGLFAQNI